jgi:hypothetical protein
VEDQVSSAGSRMPSAKFLDTAQQLAQMTLLDTDMIVNGHPIHFKGINFWLQHYGAADPGGMVVMIEIGALTSQNEGPICKELLEQQFIHPVGVNGYYCLLPGTGVVAYGLRIDFEGTFDPADAIVDFVEMMAAQREALAMSSRELTGFSNGGCAAVPFGSPAAGQFFA